MQIKSTSLNVWEALFKIIDNISEICERIYKVNGKKWKTMTLIWTFVMKWQDLCALNELTAEVA